MSSPAREWRDTVRRGMSHVSGDDDALLGFLERSYPAARGLERYVMAVALLTFGRLDTVEAILAEMPPVGHPARILARAIDALLPTNANAIADPAATRAWLDAHRDRLRWNETDGRFHLDPPDKARKLPG
ncbi:hypothetical protein K1W54_14195 [Micromonospora sp. CPCC 205371]|nr:hypothetical protein [Micromonospora sp. CPCC 205371]